MAHPPRIPVYLSREQGVVYFVTFCVAERRRVLDNAAAFAAFRNAVSRLEKWRVIAAVVMPDHVHVLAHPMQNRDEKLGHLSAALKRWTREALGKPRAWEWQPGCFDRLLRRDEGVDEKWDYMRKNPVRAGLVPQWQGWPYRIDPLWADAEAAL